MKPKSTARPLLAIAAISLVAVSSVHAQSTVYWDGGTVDLADPGNGASGGTSGTWDTTIKNWDAGATYVAWDNTNTLGNPADIAVFAGTAGTVTLGTGITAGGLTFSTTGYTITGSTLTLTGTATISAAVTTSTISSNIDGTAGLTKTGAGTLILSGTNNTYSGTTTISAGNLQGIKSSTSGPSPFGTSTIQLNAGTLGSFTASATDAGETFTFGNDINVGGNATINFTRVGGVGSGKTHAYGNLSIGSSTLSFTANAISHTFSFTGANLTGNAIINTGNNATTNIGAINETSGPRNLTKQGSAVLRLLGTNTYTGTTTISAGTLEVQGSIASSSGITNNATLTFNSASAQSYSNVISGSGSLTKSGSGTLSLLGLNEYTGTTTIGSNLTNATITINTLKNYGEASSLGAPTSGDIIFFKQAVNNLVYVGIGNTTNRTIRHEADVSNRNNGSGIYNNGTGALIFNGTTFNTPFVASGNATRTTVFNLGGTYSGNANEIRGVIADNEISTSSLIGMTKNADTSIWQFSGANTYSGINTISGGTLRGTQTSGTPFGTGAVTINAGTLSLAPTGSGSAVSLTGGTRAAGTLFTYNAGAMLSLARGSQDSLTYTFGGTGNTTARGTNGTLILSTSDIANFGTDGSKTERFIMNGTAPTQVNTIVSGVVVQDRANGNAGDFAAYDGTHGYTKASYTHTNDFTGSTNTSRVEITSATSTGNIASYAIKANATVTNSGTITLGSSGNPAALILNGGSISGGTLAAASGNPEFLIYTSGTSSISSAITSTNTGMSVFGPGSLALSSSNSFTGGLRVNNSTLIVTNDNQLGGANNALTLRGGTLQTSGDSLAIGAGARAITLLAGQDQTGGTFNVTSGTTTFQNNSSSARIISGSGSLTKTGAGILELTGNTTNTYTGGSFVNQGTLLLGNNNMLADTGLITVNGGTVGIQTFSDTVGAVTLTSGSITGTGGTLTGSSYDVRSGSVSANLGGSGALTKSTLGTVTLTGTNTYSGATTVSQGVLDIQHATALGTTAGGTSVSSGAALEIQGGITVGAEALTLNGTGISNGGALRNISGDNIYGGQITLAGHSRIHSDAGLLTLDVASGDAITGTFNLTFGGAGDITVADAIGIGSGTLTKSGTGTFTITSAVTYTGGTFVEGGTMVVAESLGNSAVSVSNLGTILATDAAAAFGGTVTINNEAIFAVGGNGSAGTATIAGNTTFKNGSIFSWDINNNGTAYDKVVGPSLSGELTEGDAIFRIVVEDSGFTNGFWATDQTWTDIFMVDGTNPIANWADLFSVAVVDSDLDPLSTDSFGTFSVDGNTLTWTAIPEPTTALGGLLLGAGLLRRRRGEKV